MFRALPTCLPITRCSAGPKICLIEEYCLRCSRCIAGETTMVCNCDTNIKCLYCLKLHKQCIPVPALFTRKVNTLVRLVNRINDLAEPSAGIVTALVHRQKLYNKQVTVYLRISGRHNLPAKLKSSVEMGLLILEQLKRQSNALEGILDVLHYDKKLSVIVHNDEDADAGDFSVYVEQVVGGEEECSSAVGSGDEEKDDNEMNMSA